MTYNFDPEKWYAIRRAGLERQRDEGLLDAAAFAQAIAELDVRLEEILARQDARFAVPGGDADR